MNYYKRHLGDYAKDTGHLSALEHGVYTLLLDWYYASEKTIPASKVYRITKANTAAERHATDVVLADFFQLDGENWRNKRADSEIEVMRIAAEQHREAGRRGGRPPKPKRLSGENQTVFPQKPNEKLATSHKPLNQDNSFPVDNSPQDWDVSTGPEGAESGGPEGEPIDLHAEALKANPALAAIVRLRQRGGYWLRLTPDNPEVHAAIREGVFVESIEALAEAYPDKPPLYVITAARRQRATPAAKVSGDAHGNRSTSRKPSATERVVANIEARRKAEQAGVVASLDGPVVGEDGVEVRRHVGG